jgi:hypothetical protein
LNVAPNDRQRSLDTKPQVLELPVDTAPPHRAGDMIIGTDGSIGVWTTDKIYCTSHQRLMDHFEPWANSIPPSCAHREQPRRKPMMKDDLP